MRLLVSAIGLLAMLVAFATGPDRESARSVPTDPWLRIDVRPDAVEITGIVSSVGHEAILGQTASMRFPGKSVRFDVEVRPALPPGWALVTDLTLRALAATRSAVAEIRADRLDVSGITGDAEAWSEGVALIEKNLPNGMHLTQQVEEVGPRDSLERQCIALFRTAMRGRRIEFPMSGSALGTEAFPLLDELIQIAVDCPQSSIVVTGHTDRTGAESTNEALSQARADAVADYLVAGGLPAGRISATGVGSSDPMVPGSDARARRLNRRIDIEMRFP